MSGTDTREGASTRDGGLQTASCPPTPPARCLVHIVRSTSLKYSKVRQFQEHFQFDVCRHEVRYGCLREDSCHFAHSFIELKVWLLQQYSGEGSGGGSGEDSGGGSGEGEDRRVQRRTVMLWWGAAEKPVLPGHPRTQRLCIRGFQPQKTLGLSLHGHCQGSQCRGARRQSSMGHLGGLVTSGPSPSPSAPL